MWQNRKNPQMYQFIKNEKMSAQSVHKIEDLYQCSVDV